MRDVRYDERHQLAHKLGLSTSNIRKVQEGRWRDAGLDTIDALIHHFFPGKVMGRDGALTGRVSGALARWVAPSKSDEKDVFWL